VWFQGDQPSGGIACQAGFGRPVCNKYFLRYGKSLIFNSETIGFLSEFLTISAASQKRRPQPENDVKTVDYKNFLELSVFSSTRPPVPFPLPQEKISVL
jgi:hypothetical protein